jgi:hypothetical protein
VLVPRPHSSLSALAELLSERVSPELLYLETKFASLMSYGLTVRPMGELLPLDRPIRGEQVRRHLFRGAVANDVEIWLPTSPDDEVIGSGCQVNALRCELFGEGLLVVDLAHGDLA